MKKNYSTILILLLFTAAGTTQTRWKRAEPASTELQLFHSLAAVSLPTIDGWQQDYNSLAFGLELETGGHFLKYFCATKIE